MIPFDVVSDTTSLSLSTIYTGVTNVGWASSLSSISSRVSQAGAISSARRKKAIVNCFRCIMTLPVIYPFHGFPPEFTLAQAGAGMTAH